MYDKIVITNMQKCGFEEKCQLELFRFNPLKIQSQNTDDAGINGANKATVMDKMNSHNVEAQGKVSSTLFLTGTD